MAVNGGKSITTLQMQQTPHIHPSSPEASCVSIRPHTLSLSLSFSFTRPAPNKCKYMISSSADTKVEPPPHHRRPLPMQIPLPDNRKHPLKRSKNLGSKKQTKLKSRNIVYTAMRETGLIEKKNKKKWKIVRKESLLNLTQPSPYPLLQRRIILSL